MGQDKSCFPFNLRRFFLPHSQTFFLSFLRKNELLWYVFHKPEFNSVCFSIKCILIQECLDICTGKNTQSKKMLLSFTIAPMNKLLMWLLWIKMSAKLKKDNGFLHQLAGVCSKKNASRCLYHRICTLLKDKLSVISHCPS